MAVSVLIVDDSAFFRRRLTELIAGCPELRVAGTASNGQEAIEQARALRPDVITMDYEMPVMDGITALRAIMAEQPTPVLMFSSLTYEGARVTLEALEAGAVDFLPKNLAEISGSAEALRSRLGEKLLAIARGGRQRDRRSLQPPESVPAATAPPPARRRWQKPPSVVVIGASTGGPVALQQMLMPLPAGYPVPLLLVQHMPASFTPAFAERLDSLCRIRVREARDGDVLEPGLALVAPGGRQLLISRGNRVRVLPGDERLTYRPSVDVSFAAAASTHGAGALGVVLTGMGSDGCEGARVLKQAGATVWAQDEASSVIYGMPMAVARAGLADEILSLAALRDRLAAFADSAAPVRP